MHEQNRISKEIEGNIKLDDQLAAWRDERINSFNETFEGKTNIEKVKIAFEYAHKGLATATSDENIEKGFACLTKWGLNILTGKAAGEIFTITGQGLGTLAEGATQTGNELSKLLSGKITTLNGDTLVVITDTVAEAETIRTTIATTAGVVADLTEIVVPAAAFFKEGPELGRGKDQKITNINRDALLNELARFKSVKLQVGPHKILLDKKGLKHILERHHPEFWNGSIKSSQSFFDKKMNVEEMTTIIKKVITQNREKIMER